MRRQLRKMGEEVNEPLRETMRNIGSDLESALEAAAPKRTGDLAIAAHSRVSSDGLAVKIGYAHKEAGFKRWWKRGGYVAIFQEWGTKHHPAQPFIRPTFRQRVPIYLNMIDDTVRQVLRRASKW